MTSQWQSEPDFHLFLQKSIMSTLEICLATFEIVRTNIWRVWTCLVHFAINLVIFESKVTSLTKSLKRTGIPPVFKEWSQLAQGRSNWRKLFYSKAEFPPTRQNWSFCSHFCMYFSHFRTSESIDVQSSAMQTHLHSKLLKTPKQNESAHPKNGVKKMILF